MKLTVSFRTEIDQRRAIYQRRKRSKLDELLLLSNSIYKVDLIHVNTKRKINALKSNLTIQSIEIQSKVCLLCTETRFDKKRSGMRLKKVFQVVFLYDALKYNSKKCNVSERYLKNH